MKCCLCRNREAIRTEQRRSGDAGQLETWHFCTKCWREMERQRLNFDPEICGHYVILAKYICGIYDRAGKILPKEIA